MSLDLNLEGLFKYFLSYILGKDYMSTFKLGNQYNAVNFM